MEYFARFVLDKNQARRDRRRGYSFSSYALFPTKDEAREFWCELGVSDPEIGRCKHGFGLALDGLCGFGPFETLEEATQFALETCGYNGVEWPVAAIYTGHYVGQADCGDGDVFSPTRLIKTLEV